MKIAIYQLTSLYDFEENLKKIDEACLQVKRSGANILFLPECFYSLSNGLKPTEYLVEQNNEHYKNISNLAKKHELYLIGGSAATKLKGSIINRAYNFDPQGNELSHYDKMHLFSCSLKKDGTSIDEADIYTSGTKPQSIEVEGWKIGLGICFDLRYPEMSRKYAVEGATILTFSSAFTVPTGKAHWHTLLKARAIENQCYVVAAAQWGKNNERIQTYGHSLIIDPWGEVLADAGEGEKIIFAELDHERVKQVRDSVGVYKYLKP
tara:strand:- start:19497 stop:20291 length:795 start_codon:yes stop_codon:yes gene_type:complete